MSLLKKASIITTPTAYAEDYLYSIKPAYALGLELVTNGDYSNGTTNWDATRNATLTASNNVLTVASDSSTFGGAARQVVTVVVGKKYKWEFTINEANDTRVGIRNGTADFGSGASILDINDLGVGTHTYTFKATATSVSIILGTMTLSGQEKYSNVSLKEITDADFDFTRNSTGTRLNEDYLIEDVPYNLVTYSEDFTNWLQTRNTVTANTIIAPNGTLTADKIAANATFVTNTSRVKQNITSTNARTFSVFAKAGEITEMLIYAAGTNNGVYFNLTNGSFVNYFSGATNISGYNIENYKDGWNRFSVTFSAANTTIEIYLSKNNSVIANYTIGEGFYVWGGQLVKGDQPKDYLKTTDRLDIPRIDYTNGEPSILLEPSRQNVFPYNIDFSNAAWTKSNLSVTANSITSPEGITNATLVTENSSNILHYLSDAVSVTSGTSYTVSVYAKKKERNVLQIVLSTNFLAASYANYDLDNGVVSATGGVVTAQMIDMPNDWYRCILTFTATATNSGSPLFALQTSTTASRGAAYQGDGSSGLYLYGAQFEEGSYATSLIHTSGSAVTRSADAANNAGNSDLFNDSEGVLYAEIKALANDLSFRVLTISDGSTSNNVGFGYRNNSNVIYTFVQNVINSSSSVTVADITEYHKIAIKYKSGDFAMYIDGREVYTSSSSFTLSGLNELGLDNGATASASFYANAKSVMVFKEALTDLELEKLTGYNNHELYMNYYNRLSYLGLLEEYNVESDINNYIL